MAGHFAAYYAFLTDEQLSEHISSCKAFGLCLSCQRKSTELQERYLDRQKEKKEASAEA